MGILLLYISVTLYFLKNNKCYLLGTDKRKIKRKKYKLLSHSLGTE